MCLLRTFKCTKGETLVVVVPLLLSKILLGWVTGFSTKGPLCWLPSTCEPFSIKRFADQVANGGYVIVFTTYSFVETIREDMIVRLDFLLRIRLSRIKAGISITQEH